MLLILRPYKLETCFQPFTQSSLCGPGNHKPHKYLCTCVLNVTRMHHFMLKFQIFPGEHAPRTPLAGRRLHGRWEWTPPLSKAGYTHVCYDGRTAAGLPAVSKRGAWKVEGVGMVYTPALLCMGFAVRVRSAGQKYGPTCHQRDRADVTEFVTFVRLSSLGQHVDVLALAGYKRRKSALTAGPIKGSHPIGGSASILNETVVSMSCQEFILPCTYLLHEDTSM